MSTTYHAAAVIGCRIERSQLFCTEQKRGCGHDLPQPWATSEAKFCDQCGNQLWIGLQTAIPEYDQGKGTVCGFRLIDNHWDDYVYVVGEISTTNTDGALTTKLTPDLIHIQDCFELELSGTDLWDEDEFGIWPFLWYS